MTDSQSPLVVACTLESGDLAGQAARWRRLRAAAGRSRAETTVGLRLTFADSPGVDAELQALTAVENDCCSWARWEVGREAGELVLSVRSTAHGVDALHAMFREVSDTGAG